MARGCELSLLLAFGVEMTMSTPLQKGDGLGLLGREGMCGRGGLGVGL